MNSSRSEHKPSAQPIINFAGESVALGPLRQEMIPLYNQWNNDFIVNYLNFVPIKAQVIKR
jgi:hypothetical protein